MWQEYLSWGLLVILGLVFATLFGYKEREVQLIEKNAENQRQRVKELERRVLEYKQWKQ